MPSTFHPARGVAVALAVCAAAQAAEPTAAQQLLRPIYQELVEIDTTDSAGSCTEARRRWPRA